MSAKLAMSGLITLALLASVSHAGVYEFQLPDLSGMTADTSLTTTFVYHGPDGAVNSLSVSIAGFIDYLGLVECAGAPPDTSIWPLDFSTFLRKAGDTGYWSGFPGVLDQVGSFDRTYGLHTFNGGFGTVSDGDTIQVDAHFFPAGLVGICGPITGPSTGFLTQASVVLDVSALVAAEESTWGRIKGLYRTR